MEKWIISVVSLHDEVDILVLKPVPKVDITEFARVQPVEELEAWPRDGSNQGSVASFAQLQIPGAVWRILAN